MTQKARTTIFATLFGAVVATVVCLWPDRTWAFTFGGLCIIMWLLIVNYHNSPSKRKKKDVAIITITPDCITISTDGPVHIGGDPSKVVSGPELVDVFSKLEKLFAQLVNRPDKPTS